MIRKPIAASIYNQGDATSPDPVIVVVCDDGSVWERALGSNYPRWRRQLPVPDTPASVEFDAACAAHKASLTEDDEPF
jgi:hypothetical protein